MTELRIEVEDPRTADVVTLLERHLAFHRTHSPPEHIHALDLDGLTDPAVTFISARRDGTLVAIGALRALDDHHSEIKSMHTAAEVRGQGVARAVLTHLLAIAHERGDTRVSLETAPMEPYAPARALYESVGFEPCAPFGDYTDNPFSRCMSLDLTDPDTTTSAS